MNKILFLDIDGVFIPRRAYFMSAQTRPIVRTFCPSIVGMVNSICEKTGAKLVIHSSWIRTSLHLVDPDYQFTSTENMVMQHMINEGIKSEYFHDTHPECKYRFSGTRWLAILEWLEDAREREGIDFDYFILEDEHMPESVIGLDRTRHVHTHFDDGLTMDDYWYIMQSWIPAINKDHYAAMRGYWKGEKGDKYEDAMIFCVTNGLIDENETITERGWDAIELYRSGDEYGLYEKYGE